MKRETYPQARARLFAYLRTQGWAMKPDLKVPQAIRNGVKLYFHPRVVYLHEHSLMIDIRGMDGVSFDGKVVAALHARWNNAH